MTDTYKPTGYTSVSPYLIVDGASRSIDFLTRVFDARELRRFADEQGKVRHAEVRLGEVCAAEFRALERVRIDPV